MDYASDNVFRCKFIWRGLVQVCSHLLSIRFIANGYIVVVLVFVCTSFFCTDELFPFLRLMVVNEKRMQHTLRFVASFRNERFVCIFSLSLFPSPFLMLILFLSRLTLFGAMSGMEKWWRSHKNFALKYRFVSVFRLCSVFIYCCSLVLIKSAFAYIKVSQWENARERTRGG